MRLHKSTMKWYIIRVFHSIFFSGITSIHALSKRSTWTRIYRLFVTHLRGNFSFVKKSEVTLNAKSQMIWWRCKFAKTGFCSMIATTTTKATRTGMAKKQAIFKTQCKIQNVNNSPAAKHVSNETSVQWSNINPWRAHTHSACEKSRSKAKKKTKSDCLPILWLWLICFILHCVCYTSTIFFASLVFYYLGGLDSYRSTNDIDDSSACDFENTTV